MTRCRPIVLFLTLLAVSACAAANRAPAETGSSGTGNAIVFDDESLSASRGGLLPALQSRVSGMRVSRTDICPHVVLRGGSGRSIASEPLVYLNGQRIGDTCILDSIDVDAIERVEVYPNGVTSRPGYHSDSGGLILIFFKDGSGRSAPPAIE